MDFERVQSGMVAVEGKGMSVYKMVGTKRVFSFSFFLNYIILLRGGRNLLIIGTAREWM